MGYRDVKKSDKKAKMIVRISAAVIAVFLLISLAANEAKPGKDRWQTLESTPGEAIAAPPDTAPQGTPDAGAPEDPAAANGSILGASYSPEPDAAASGTGNAAAGETDAAGSTYYGPGATTEEEGGPGGQTEDPGEQDVEEADGQDAEADTEQPVQPYTMTNAGNGGGDGSKIAYITIDDGPTRNITPGILDILAQEGIKATFFVLPHDGVHDLYQRILDEGHEIGNHSYSHVYARLYNSGDLETFREDVLKARDWVYDNFGYLTTTFRFPGGMMGRSSSIVAPRREILEEIGYRYFDWNIDTGDANSRQTDKSAAALTGNVLRNTQGRERIIVLMHDTSDKRTTLEALPGIIAGLREQGYVFDILRNYEAPQPAAATATPLVSEATQIPPESEATPTSLTSG